MCLPRLSGYAPAGMRADPCVKENAAFVSTT